jgi:DNA-binding transcriptional MerR regulator
MEEVKSFPKGFCKDEVELLKPIKVDHFTGHRHYFAHQLSRLNRSLAWKDLGFSLERIKLMLADGPTLEQLRGMLKMQRGEVEKRLSDEQERFSFNPRFA